MNHASDRSNAFVPIMTQGGLFELAVKTLGYSIKAVGSLRKKGVGEKHSARPIFEISHNGKKLLNTGAVTEETSYLGMRMAVNKVFTSQYLRNEGIPVPEQKEITSGVDAREILKKHGSIVIKPAASRAGKGVFGGVTDEIQAQAAVESIKKELPKGVIIAEEEVYGDEFRVVIIDGKFAAAARYQPPVIRGDGTSTIRQIIDQENTSPLRKNGTLYPIKDNESLIMQLAALGLSFDSVPEKDATILIHRSAPISGGGTVVDATEHVSLENQQLLERVASVMRLNITGIDIIAPSLETPLASSGGRIIEVNGGPDFRIHYNVHEGKRRNLAEIVLKNFFEGRPA